MGYMIMQTPYHVNATALSTIRTLLLPNSEVAAIHLPKEHDKVTNK